MGIGGVGGYGNVNRTGGVVTNYLNRINNYGNQTGVKPKQEPKYDYVCTGGWNSFWQGVGHWLAGGNVKW